MPTFTRTEADQAELLTRINAAVPMSSQSAEHATDPTLKATAAKSAEFFGHIRAVL
jgi:hypothetical protein